VPCNSHDICYSSCGSNKAMCDTVFKNDIIHQCTLTSATQECDLCANTLFDAVDLFGSSAFTDAQKEHCGCAQGGVYIIETFSDYFYDEQYGTFPPGDIIVVRDGILVNMDPAFSCNHVFLETSTYFQSSCEGNSPATFYKDQMTISNGVYFLARSFDTLYFQTGVTFSTNQNPSKPSSSNRDSDRDRDSDSDSDRDSDRDRAPIASSCSSIRGCKSVSQEGSKIIDAKVFLGRFNVTNNHTLNTLDMVFSVYDGSNSSSISALITDPKLASKYQQLQLGVSPQLKRPVIVTSLIILFIGMLMYI